MTIAARRHTPPSPHVKDRNRHVRHRRLRHIHRISHTQQLALLDEARVSRRFKHLRNQILAFLPHLKMFALSLTHDAVRSDDLVQTTLLQAWTNLDRFQPDTNLEAWLFTILRNSFHSEYRKRRREVEDPDGAHARRLMVQPEQEAKVMLDDVHQALMRLPLEQREAILLIGCQGESYEDAAAICGVAVGTMKSCVNRARSQLVELLQMEDRHDIGLDRLTQAALQEPTASAL